MKVKASKELCQALYDALGKPEDWSLAYGCILFWKKGYLLKNQDWEGILEYSKTLSLNTDSYGYSALSVFFRLAPLTISYAKCIRFPLWWRIKLHRRATKVVEYLKNKGTQEKLKAARELQNRLAALLKQGVE